MKTPNFEIYDNYSDAYSIVFSRFKKEGEEYYTNRFNEGYQRYQELLKKENEEELMLDKNQANVIIIILISMEKTMIFICGKFVVILKDNYILLIFTIIIKINKIIIEYE